MNNGQLTILTKSALWKLPLICQTTDRVQRKERHLRKIIKLITESLIFLNL